MSNPAANPAAFASTHSPPFPELPPQAVRAALLAREEIALIDVREEDPFAQAHPLWAANLPLARIELDAWGRIPRLGTRIVVYGGDDALRAATRLRALGYGQVHLLAGGLAGWRDAGGELFRDVNVPSKSFGEWVEAHRHTPSLPAEEVGALIRGGADVVVLDARRFDEYQAMSIPGAISVPGAELVLRVRDLAPRPETRVIVNCAGRTRSIIGTQSLVNAGIPNPVAALRNGTIGWTLAGQKLSHGASRRPGAVVSHEARRAAQQGARAVAERAGVRRVDTAQLAVWRAEAGRTTYCFDVRSAEEYAAGHQRGFRSAPGGQLVQETDVHAPVRGARIVLADLVGSAGALPGSADAGVRAEMTASWLAQMGWEVAVLEPRAGAAPRRDEAFERSDELETGPDRAPRPEPPPAIRVSPSTLAEWISAGDRVEPGEAAAGAAQASAEKAAEASAVAMQVIDVGPSASHVKGHIPGAWFALRSQLAKALQKIPAARRYVVTCKDALLAPYAARELAGILGEGGEGRVFVLEGGTAAWVAAGFPLESGQARLASPPIDRYRRPYEGTDNAPAAMQAYLDWEYGLVAQLERDGTHHFAPI